MLGIGRGGMGFEFFYPNGGAILVLSWGLVGYSDLMKWKCISEDGIWSSVAETLKTLSSFFLFNSGKCPGTASHYQCVQF